MARDPTQCKINKNFQPTPHIPPKSSLHRPHMRLMVNIYL